MSRHIFSYIIFAIASPSLTEPPQGINITHTGLDFLAFK